MQTRTVEYYVEGDGEGVPDTEIKVTVSQATVLMGMRRAVLQGSAESWVASRRADVLAGQEDDESDTDVVTVGDVDSSNGNRPELLNLMAGSLAARILYPDLLACVRESEGLDTDALTVDAFLELPDRLVNAWEAAVYELNPQWLPGDRGSAESEAAEKKG